MGQALKEGDCPTFTWRKVALFFLLLNLLLIIGLACSYYSLGAEASLRPELRVMLLGKNGPAKRVLGNAILGRKAFPPKPEIAIIHQCRGENGLVLGERNVTVLDTLDMAQRLNVCVYWVMPGLW
ncbi:GTPase IMAP family member 2-like [Alosa pseudoharengus]|uniref:GTPase IMAP family member 2-like n=1 Tax=Alosa pseudoharengus TaxID=34774 RepID=UPI003F8CEC2C